MGAERWRVSRARWVATAVVGAAIGLAGVGWSGGVAWASAHSPAGKSERQSGDHTGRRQGRSKLPVIENATNLSREPVVRPTKGKPPGKLEKKDLVVGTGATVTSSSTVSVMYVGANYKTGKDFTQATWTSKRATTFPLSGVIPGFAEGLIGMKVGGRREIVIPSSLGYGDHSTGPIVANETLVFVVDLKGVSG